MRHLLRSHTRLVVGTVLWGEDFSVIHRGRLLIRDGVIERMLSETEAYPSEAEICDFGDCVVLPGLIDTHCHLTLPGDGRDPDVFLQSSSDEELVTMGFSNAMQAVTGGVTTLRDLGSKNDTGFEVSERIASTAGPMPRVIVSGPVITRVGGHGWTFGRQVVDAADAARSVRDLSAKGADLIKVMASGGSTPGTQTWNSAFTTDELKSITSQAHRLGLPVAAHVSCPAAAAQCLEAEVDDIEHLNLWANASYENQVSNPLLKRIEQSQVFVGPTLQTSYRILHEPSSSVDPREEIRKKLNDDVLSNFQIFAQMNLRLIAGSDAGFLITRFDELHLGLRLMVEHGLSTHRAIQSATTEAAAALRLQDRIGCIGPGMAADLLVVRGDPLSDITSLRDVEAVFVRGQLAHDRSSPLPTV